MPCLDERIRHSRRHSSAESSSSGGGRLAWKRGAEINRAAQAFRDFCHATYNSAGADLD